MPSMDQVLVPLILLAACTVVWSDNATKTAKLEILRSPTKVAIWKPDPYPILRSYGDDQTAPPSVRNHTATPAANLTLETSTPSENETKVDALNSTMSDNNSTLVDSTAKNTTCIRRDYEDNVAAVFEEEAGPIEAANLVFNSTAQLLEGRIFNVTDLNGLQVLNETIVDCEVYFKVKTS